MARIRSLKPDFFRSRSLARCSIGARLTFAGMWTEADDKGRGIADARLLKGALWSLDDAITHGMVTEWLRELSREHIVLYEVDGEQYFEIINWEKHQAAAYRRGESQHPARPVVQKRAKKCESVLEGKGREGKGGETHARVRARPSPVPDDFSANGRSPEWKVTQEALALDISLDRETERFIDYHRSKATTSADWDASWRTWIGNAVKFERERRAKVPKTSSGYTIGGEPV